MAEPSHSALYQRLPELYRLRDGRELTPDQLREYRGPLEEYLGIIEYAFDEIYGNIQQLYHDLFIEHCDPWVIPYIGDLLGTSHLKGDEATLRRDVAATIALRRRKGTIGAIETLTYNLTKWGVHVVEMRERMAWTQHLNHQRPDLGGDPPYGDKVPAPPAAPRGGTAPIRDPALLSLAGTAFEPFSRLADVRPPTPYGAVRANLPNLAVYLWRLKDYSIPLTEVTGASRSATGATGTGEAAQAVRISTDPLERPVTLFNASRYDPDARPLIVTDIDATPGPIHPARLHSESEAGNPAKYVVVTSDEETEIGLQLAFPSADLAIQDHDWTFRGGDLCAWESGLVPKLQNQEVVIDPVRGRIVVGVNTVAKANSIKSKAELAFTYGAVGPVGAHPIDREDLKDPVTVPGDVATLQTALNRANTEGEPLVIEIRNSAIHDVDLNTVTGKVTEDGGPNLVLGRSLHIRAADKQRPIIRLARPLRFRPKTIDAEEALPSVCLEGLFLTRDQAVFPAGEPLIARAAVSALEIRDSTLDPGGHLTDSLRSRAGFVQPDPAKRPVPALPPAIRLADDHGFAAGQPSIEGSPVLRIESSIVGPLLVDPDHTIVITDSIVDAGSGINDDPATAGFALKALGSGPTTKYGAHTRVEGATFFGRVQVLTMDGVGGIWTQPLEVLNDQVCCIRFSSFTAHDNRLPQHYASVQGAVVRFTSEIFGQPGYGQLRLDTDFAVRERGPNDDAMGAFGFMFDAHKWRNIQIRFREFMPVGVRPLLIPVT